MELILRVSFCLLTFFGKTFGDVIVTTEGSNVTLNCSLPGRNLTHQVFDWKKDAKQEVFLYAKGNHYNNGRPGQDEIFKNRVQFFEDKLQSGNASILIKNTKVTDSGNYSCGFPDPMVYHKLLVGVLAKPSVRTINQNDDWAQLWCEVPGASPKPSVEWHDRSGNKHLAKEVVNHDNFILEIIVKKTGNYTCIATQMELHHKSSTTTFIHFSGQKNRAEGRKAIKFFLLLLLVVVDLLLP